jgi:hypothetical protein
MVRPSGGANFVKLPGPAVRWVGEALASLFKATEVAPTPVTEGLQILSNSY